MGGRDVGVCVLCCVCVCVCVAFWSLFVSGRQGGREEGMGGLGWRERGEVATSLPIPASFLARSWRFFMHPHLTGDHPLCAQVRVCWPGGQASPGRPASSVGV